MLKAYYELLRIVAGNSVLLEKYAREMIVQEELHMDEANKMLRRPGKTAPFIDQIGMQSLFRKRYQL